MSSAEDEDASKHSLNNQARWTPHEGSTPHSNLPPPRKLQTTQATSLQSQPGCPSQLEREHHTWFKLQMQYCTVHIQHYTCLQQYKYA